jgi:hypothetical protein
MSAFDDEYTQSILRAAQDDFSTRWKDLLKPRRTPEPLRFEPKDQSNLPQKSEFRITKPICTMRSFGGLELRESEWLTVDGEPDSAVHPDWRERYLRNESRWRAGVHRFHQKAVRIEPLFYTPQVPDPNVYRIDGVGYVAHPATVRKVMQVVSNTMRDQVNDFTTNTLMKGGW